MPSTRLLIGGAATAALGIRVARSLHGRWRALPESQRRQIESLADDLKTRALDARGTADPERARDDLRAANENFAAALVETAEADPEIGSDEVHVLREELRRELERLASADIKASRSRREPTAPPG